MKSVYHGPIRFHGKLYKVVNDRLIQPSGFGEEAKILREVRKMARHSKQVYQVLYKDGTLTKARMREVLSEEKFEMPWIGSQNSHGMNRVAVIHIADQIYYGLTSNGVKQLKKW